jgi:hypothetical protein
MLDRPEQLKAQLQRNVGCHDPRHPNVGKLNQTARMRRAA